MRILIVSDIHANPWALKAVEHDAGAVDHVICAGDTVNYGPDPRGVLSWLRERGAITVRGNHDNAIAFGVDPKASPAKQPLALVMRDWTRTQLDSADLTWLARLPTSATWEIGGCRFVLVHGTPCDPLYDYRLTPATSNGHLDELTAGVQANVLVVGHTHLPLLRRSRNMHVLNPGSVGQPLDGDNRASYAVWEDGVAMLRRVAYDQADVIGAVRALPLPASFLDDLVNMLRNARLDKAPAEQGASL
jgi:putative phosphoesterase